jgi:hypothetical protein
MECRSHRMRLTHTRGGEGKGGTLSPPLHRVPEQLNQLNQLNLPPWWKGDLTELTDLTALARRGMGEGRFLPCPSPSLRPGASAVKSVKPVKSPSLVWGGLTVLAELSVATGLTALPSSPLTPRGEGEGKFSPSLPPPIRGHRS